MSIKGARSGEALFSFARMLPLKMSTIPADLRNAIASDPEVKAKWRDLTPIAQRDFISWIDGAKQEATRLRRIERTCDILLSGKRRPCCYAVVPLDLHNALKATPLAKKHWSALSSDARRDFIDWIASAKARELRKQRIERACNMIAAGKDHP